jgi:hypothetical protein
MCTKGRVGQGAAKRETNANRLNKKKFLLCVTQWSSVFLCVSSLILFYYTEVAEKAQSDTENKEII